MDLLGDGVDLWDFARIKECVCGAAEGCADVEGEHKLPGGAFIGCAVHREMVTASHKSKAVCIFLDARHTFLKRHHPLLLGE